MGAYDALTSKRTTLYSNDGDLIRPICGSLIGCMRCRLMVRLHYECFVLTCAEFV